MSLIPPPTYWPTLSALAVGAFQLVWNATMYHNPITQADVTAAVISAGLAFAFASQCLSQVPPSGK